MHKLNLTRTLAMAAVIGIAGVASASKKIARWNFNALVAAPDNSTTPTTDINTATLTQLGMTNGYTNSMGVVGSQASCDVLLTGGDPNTPPSTGYTWRVRGNGNLANGAAGGNGWSLSAPQYTQGAELDVSTVGYNNIGFSFDFYSTTQGVADLQIQYNTNINNAAGWTNYQGAMNGNQAVVHDAAGDTELVATSNNFNTVGTDVLTNAISLAGVAGANNDANFGIRIVSAYDPTSGTYNSAAGGVYNNNSGNWRFDQIDLTGTAAAPELPTGVIFGVVGLGLIFVRSRRS